MPSRKVQFVNGEIYHIYNRGVEKRDIFEQAGDYLRFILCLYRFNNRNKVDMRYVGPTYGYGNEGKGGNGSRNKRNREPLVEILAFCLMPNHFHLIVRQIQESGISLFMKKLGDGYVGYFNIKYDRVGMGSLFQGPFKAIHIKTTDQLVNLVVYVFTNPVELIEKEWKEKGVVDLESSINFLESYRWSSYLDCIGKKNFPFVAEAEFLYQVFGSSEKIKNFVDSWISYKAEMREGLDKIKDLALEN